MVPIPFELEVLFSGKEIIRYDRLFILYRLDVPFAIIGILFAIFKEVHFDNQKTFEKYLLK